jgi:hypothetical protein
VRQALDDTCCESKYAERNGLDLVEVRRVEECPVFHDDDEGVQIDRRDIKRDLASKLSINR